MTVDYSVFNPTGNVTIFVDTPVPVNLHSVVSRQLLHAEPSAEQVGFVMYDDAAGIRIRMAGGEFCGNAAMSAGAYYCMLNKINLETDVSVAISGAEFSLNVHILPLGDFSYIGSVSMPAHTAVSDVSLNCDNGYVILPAVEYDGITHIIVSDNELSYTEAQRRISSWCIVLGCDALGIMFYNKSDDSLTPVVYVRDIDSAYWEKSCASGTSALGTWIFSKSGLPFTRSFTEPGGILTVAATESGCITLTGKTTFVKHASLDIE